MALPSASFNNTPQPPRNASADADARAPYASGSATRMDREAGVHNVAAQHTSSTSGKSAIGAPFIGEDHQWTSTPGKQSAAKVAGTPGFPGNSFEYPNA